MNGTVTIPLDEFDKLRAESKEAEELKSNTLRAAKEIEVFLSFLVTREGMQEYLEEFNRQSTRSQILVVDGRAKIKFNEKS